MARRPRAAPVGVPQHVIHRGNNRQVCFASEDDMRAYLYWLKEYAVKFKVEVDAWVLMENKDSRHQLTPNISISSYAHVRLLSGRISRLCMLPVKENAMLKHLIILLSICFSLNAFAAVNVDSLPDKKKTPQGLYLTAKDADQLINKAPEKVLFLDVRTQAELEFVGMADSVDANIPYLTFNADSWDSKKNTFAKTPNSAFQGSVENALKAKGLTKNDPIIVMCRSGSRSSKAANLLHKLGYTKVYSVVDGFEGDKAKDGLHKGQRVVNGWKNTGLPWSYKLDKQKMYFEF